MTAAVVDRTNPLPLWAQVLENLRVRLGAHEFDDRFPTDSELVDDYGVSRQTVREAVRRLSADGLLDRERGRGTFVRAAVLRQPVGTLPEIFRSIRQTLGPVTSTIRRVERATDSDVASRLELDPSAGLVVVERVRHVAGAPIAHDLAWLPAAVADPLLDADFTTAVLADEVRERCGLRADDVDEQIAAAIPSPGQRELIEVPAEVALLVVSTRSSSHGVPFECRQVSFRADRIQLSSRWTGSARTSPGIGVSAG